MSAVAFDFFHLDPIGRLTVTRSSDWVALAVFAVVAVLASSVSDIARARTRDAEDRRREADLAAELARLLLLGNSLEQALPTVAARVAATLGLHSAAIEMTAVPGDQRRVAFPCATAPARSQRCWWGRTRPLAACSGSPSGLCPRWRRSSARRSSAND